ncbi:TetR/AcrR family transcriptional regulator [Nocardioides sp.]|uniref:TetR/AcrR family transcriptional regulator n=1 Tax=Nocardioides sp. TaxID=35761 RepID=UPI002B53008C|nr:TetR/AcrR family transcriptional regulator [Nocardioides sp.]HSX66876.1 TetR/AcrR family transcriptional regulator [Nocardioides sp.]
MSQLVDDTRSVDGRDRRWEDHRQGRRESLLVAALEVIDREGGDVGVAAIATRAGIPRSVVYKLFRDRDDLDTQIRLRIIDDMNATLAPLLVPQGTVREMVGRGVRTYVEWVSEHANLHRFLGAGSAARPTHGSPQATGGKTAFAMGLKELIEGVIPLVVETRLPRGAAENLAFAIIGQVDSVVNRWLLAGRSRSTKKDLVTFLTDATCGSIQAAAQISGVDLDVDADLMA